MRDVLRFIFLVITGRFRNAFEILRQLRVGTQLSFVALGIASYALHQYPKELYSFGEWGYHAARLTTASSGESIPLSRGARRQLAELIETLQNDLTIELMRRDLGVAQGYNTWAVAQAVVALGTGLRVEPAAVQSFYERSIDEGCACWRETPEKQPHTGATSWTVFSMSSMGIAAPPRVLDSLLGLQSREGWWPLHPAKPEPKSASTYATAWATLALCSQLPVHQAAKKAIDSERIKFAITNSLNWLDKNEIASSARWLDYPANTPSIKSVSISGLITHVKRQCNPGEEGRALYGRWMDSLPLDVTSAATTEASNTYITLSNGALDFDRTRHYVLQWMLVATVDSYGSGSLAQRARAVQWIERILTPALVSPEVRNQNWVAAELLYSLRYLQSHVARAGGQPSSS